MNDTNQLGIDFQAMESMCSIKIKQEPPDDYEISEPFESKEVMCWTDSDFSSEINTKEIKRENLDDGAEENILDIKPVINTPHSQKLASNESDGINDATYDFADSGHTSSHTNIEKIYFNASSLNYQNSIGVMDIPALLPIPCLLPDETCEMVSKDNQNFRSPPKLSKMKLYRSNNSWSTINYNLRKRDASKNYCEDDDDCQERVMDDKNSCCHSVQGPMAGSALCYNVGMKRKSVSVNLHKLPDSVYQKHLNNESIIVKNDSFSSHNTCIKCNNQRTKMNFKIMKTDFHNKFNGEALCKEDHSYSKLPVISCLKNVKAVYSINGKTYYCKDLKYISVLQNKSKNDMKNATVTSKLQNNIQTLFEGKIDNCSKPIRAIQINLAISPAKTENEKNNFEVMKKESSEVGNKTLPNSTTKSVTGDLLRTYLTSDDLNVKNDNKHRKISDVNLVEKPNSGNVNEIFPKHGKLAHKIDPDTPMISKDSDLENVQKSNVLKFADKALNIEKSVNFITSPAANLSVPVTRQYKIPDINFTYGSVPNICVVNQHLQSASPVTNVSVVKNPSKLPKSAASTCTPVRKELKSSDYAKKCVIDKTRSQAVSIRSPQKFVQKPVKLVKSVQDPNISVTNNTSKLSFPSTASLLHTSSGKIVKCLVNSATSSPKSMGNKIGKVPVPQVCSSRDVPKSLVSQISSTGLASNVCFIDKAASSLANPSTVVCHQYSKQNDHFITNTNIRGMPKIESVGRVFVVDKNSCPDVNYKKNSVSEQSKQLTSVERTQNKKFVSILPKIHSTTNANLQKESSTITSNPHLLSAHKKYKKTKQASAGNVNDLRSVSSSKSSRTLFIQIGKSYVNANRMKLENFEKLQNISLFSK